MPNYQRVKHAIVRDLRFWVRLKTKIANHLRVLLSKKVAILEMQLQFAEIGGIIGR